MLTAVCIYTRNLRGQRLRMTVEPYPDALGTALFSPRDLNATISRL